MKKNNLKSVNMSEYNRECNKIIKKKHSVSDTLIELLKYAGTVNVEWVNDNCPKEYQGVGDDVCWTCPLSICPYMKGEK